MKAVRVSLAVLLLGAIGCATLKPVSQPARFIPEHNPVVVYVTKTDSSIIPVVQARISGDTLLGTWRGRSEPVAIPLSEVQIIRVVQHDTKRTTLLIAGITALAAAGMYSVLQPTGSGTAEPCVYSMDMMGGMIC